MSDQVDQDFSHARFGAFLNAVRAALRQQPTTLLPFEEVRSRVFIRGQRDTGFQTVPLFGPAKARRRVKQHQRRPEERAFLEWSKLEHTRSGLAVVLSDPAHYETLRRHIHDHQYYLGQELMREIAIHEAAASWCDRVY